MYSKKIERLEKNKVSNMYVDVEATSIYLLYTTTIYEAPHEDWDIIRIKRRFFQTDDLISARKKAKQAETYSDFTEVDEHNVTTRKRKKPARIISDSSESEEESALHLFKKTDKPKHTASPIVTGIVDYNFFNTVASDAVISPTSVIETKSTQNNTTQSLQLPDVASNIHAIEQSSTGFQVKVVSLLTTILEQNNIILSWIRGQNDLDALQVRKTPLELPFQLPLHEEKELADIEDYLNQDDNFTQLCNYLISFCGNSPSASINQIMKHCMTNELASKFSFRGKKGKRAFEDLHLKSVIIRAVKKHFKIVVDKKLEDDMKVWLKHAPQRAQKKVLKT